MERFNALGRGAQLMLIGSVLLFFDLFLTWQDYPGDILDASGWDGFGGVILGLLNIVLIAWLIVRIASVNIPLPVSTAMTAAVIGTLILIFAIIKLLTILGDEATIWAWIGVVLAIVIAVGAFRAVQEAGGVETLRTEASSLSTSAGAGGAAAPAAAAPEAPAAEPMQSAMPASTGEATPEAAQPAAEAGETAAGMGEAAGMEGGGSGEDETPGQSA